MNILLMGMKHCGKTTIGARLAAEMGLPFFDLDELLLAEPKGNGEEATHIEELYRHRGPDAFFRMEADAFGSICASAPPGGFVLALGGRAPFNPLLSGALEQCGLLVYINTPFEIIRRRIMDRGISTLLSGPDPEGSLRKIYDERHPAYLRRARLIVDGDGKVGAIVGRIRASLKESGDGGK